MSDFFMRLFMSLVFVSVIVNFAWARTYDLSLEDAISLALGEGFQAQQQQLQLREARHDMAAAHRATKTRLDLFLQMPNFNERVQEIRLPNELPIYNTLGTMTWSGFALLQQPILWTNGNLRLTSRFQQARESIFQEQLDLTEQSKRFFSTLSVQFEQPLFVPNRLKLNLESARLRLEQEQRTYTTAQLDIAYDVTRSFYDYYRSVRTLQIRLEELDQQEKSAQLAKMKYEAGLIPEVEALQMEVDLAQSRNGALQAQGNLARSADAFKLLLGLSFEDSVHVQANIKLQTFEIDEEQAIAHGLRHRSVLRQREINRRLAEIQLKQTKADGSVRGDFSLSYERTGFSGAEPDDTPIRSLFDDSWQDLRRRPRNLGMRFTLTVPVWDSDLNRARVARSQTQLDRRELELEDQRKRVTLDIRNVIAQLREAQNRLDVLQKSEAVALRSYEIELARFENGDITALDLARNRERLTSARQNYLEAYIQYQLSVADLKRQTLYDFENNRSLIEDE